METTPIVIGLEGALAICATVGGTGFLIWKASSDAHKDIRDQLRDIRENQLCDIKETLAKLTTDLDWLKHYARTGQPPSDQA